jgi:predicted lipase
MLAAVD